MKIYRYLRIWACKENLEIYIEGKEDLYDRAAIALAHLSLHYERRKEVNNKLIEIHDKFINKMRHSPRKTVQEQRDTLMQYNERLKEDNALLDKKLGVLWDYAKQYNFLDFSAEPQLYDPNCNFIGERFDETNEGFKTATESLFKWLEKECSKDIDKVKEDMLKRKSVPTKETQRQNRIANMDKILGE